MYTLLLYFSLLFSKICNKCQFNVLPRLPFTSLPKWLLSSSKVAVPFNLANEKSPVQRFPYKTGEKVIGALPTFVTLTSDNQILFLITKTFRWSVAMKMWKSTRLSFWIFVILIALSLIWSVNWTYWNQGSSPLGKSTLQKCASERSAIDESTLQKSSWASSPCMWSMDINNVCH